MMNIIRSLSLVILSTLMCSPILSQNKRDPAERITSLEQRIHEVQERLKQMVIELNEIKSQAEFHPLPEDIRHEEFGVAVPENVQIPLYLLSRGTGGSLASYLEREIPNLRLTVISNLDEVRPSDKGKAIILFQGSLSDKFAGNYREKEFEECGEKSGYRCIFTNMSQIAADSYEGAKIPALAGAMAKNIVPKIESLEFRHIFSNYYPSDRDSNNRRYIELLKSVIKPQH